MIDTLVETVKAQYYEEQLNKNHYFTKEDIFSYMKETNRESAYGVVLLVGPDGFEHYEEWEELEKLLRD